MITIWVLMVTTLMTNGAMVVHKEAKERGHYKSEVMCSAAATEINNGPRGVSRMSDLLNEKYKRNNYKGPVPRMWPQYDSAECYAREIEK